MKSKDDMMKPDISRESLIMVSDPDEFYYKSQNDFFSSPNSNTSELGNNSNPNISNLTNIQFSYSPQTELEKQILESTQVPLGGNKDDNRMTIILGK